MRFFGRDDTRLALGLVVAMVVVFARPIGQLLDVAREVERTYGLALIPGLIILVAVFVFHLQDRRQSMKAEAAAAAEAARQAEERARELEVLAKLGQGLGRALDLEAVRDVLMQQLSYLVGHDGVWVLTRAGTHWEPLVGKPESSAEADAMERLADRVVEKSSEAPLTSLDLEKHTCFPMVVRDETMGVIVVSNHLVPMDEAGRRRLSAAAAMVAVSARNAQLFREVRDNSLRDGLTGLFNRAHGLEVVELELRRARRSKLPLSLMMFDLDHFKDVNDKYGHLAGDAVLAAVARRLKEVLRTSDMKCRYGGEEFLVLMPETTIAGATQVAESLRKELAAAPVTFQEHSIPVSASFGLAVALPSEIDRTALVGRADAALYRAKHEGRNCVRVSSDTVLV